MRYSFLIGLFLLIMNCAGQQITNQKKIIHESEQQELKTDLNDYSIPTEKMLNNCVFINQHPYRLIIQGNPFQINSEKELYGKIKSSKKQIAKSKFYIITDSSVDYNKIVDMLDYLGNQGFDKYQLVGSFKTIEPVKLQESNLIDSQTDLNDSSYFTIDLLNEGYEVTLQKQKTICKTDKELDNYFTTNKSMIDKMKIAIIGDPNVRDDKFGPILEALKNHDYIKFQFVNKSLVQKHNNYQLSN